MPPSAQLGQTPQRELLFLNTALPPFCQLCIHSTVECLKVSPSLSGVQWSDFCAKEEKPSVAKPRGDSKLAVAGALTLVLAIAGVLLVKEPPQLTTRG